MEQTQVVFPREPSPPAVCSRVFLGTNAGGSVVIRPPDLLQEALPPRRITAAATCRVSSAALVSATRGTAPKPRWEAGRPLPESKTLLAAESWEPHSAPLSAPCLPACLMPTWSPTPWGLVLHGHQALTLGGPPSAALVSYGGRSALIRRPGHGGALTALPSALCSRTLRPVGEGSHHSLNTAWQRCKTSPGGHRTPGIMQLGRTWPPQVVTGTSVL